MVSLLWVFVARGSPIGRRELATGSRLHRCRSPLFASARRTRLHLRPATRLRCLIIIVHGTYTVREWRRFGSRVSPCNVNFQDNSWPIEISRRRAAMYTQPPTCGTEACQVAPNLEIANFSFHERRAITICTNVSASPTLPFPMAVWSFCQPATGPCLPLDFVKSSLRAWRFSLA